MFKCIYYFLASLTLACDEAPDPIVDNSESYRWIESNFSLPPDVNLVFRLKKGLANQLYLMGFTSGGFTIFAERVDDEWKILATVEDEVYGDFAVLGDTVYYSTALALKKSRGTFAGTLINSAGQHSSLEVFENKLLIAGHHLILQGEEDYSIFAYDPGNELIALYRELPAWHVGIANNRLFVVAGGGLRYYKNHLLVDTNIPVDLTRILLGIDDNERLYYIKEGDGSLEITRSPANGETEVIGDRIESVISPPRFEIFGDSFVLAGPEFGKEHSAAFFLSSNNKWKRITTSFTIYDLIYYENRLLAASDGKILELELVPD